ncbi:winged helix-turn-helix domain-containing protein [Neolewinella agarilytica]|uniref:Transcriptional regulatory protein, C terminal n=1 Tax=Neolewinella agarilytica TaxID=478744 RepID=A0A1H9EDM6_9BACT|nr:winged helix-turn-helix domain-containing protein [Neolewinella agarilytica]SEQ23662.1 Transcriptional regulatory protein, C terminal [Neolewinella agarilytica]
MKKWTQGGLFLLGGLLLLLGLSSALLPDAEQEDERYALALRQIAHDYLICEGDETSRIPAVRTQADGGLFLQLERNIDYTSLAEVASKAINRYGIRNSYSLSLEDCESGEIFLGNLWVDPVTDPTGQTGIACGGRDQEERCANITLTFHASNAVGATGNPLFLLLPGILLLLIGGWRTRVKQPLAPAASSAVSLVDKRPPSLSPNVTFDANAQLLSVAGAGHELTYRESKLLNYLVENSNEVLRREDIHEAVWGEEGIIVGRSLDVFISRLRKKLAGAEGAEIITVHGVGYRFKVTAAGIEA